jgi:hypothetical protein
MRMALTPASLRSPVSSPVSRERRSRPPGYPLAGRGGEGRWPAVLSGLCWGCRSWNGEAVCRATPGQTGALWVLCLASRPARHSSPTSSPAPRERGCARPTAWIPRAGTPASGNEGRHRCSVCCRCSTLCCDLAGRSGQLVLCYDRNGSRPAHNQRGHEEGILNMTAGSVEIDEAMLQRLLQAFRRIQRPLTLDELTQVLLGE